MWPPVHMYMDFSWAYVPRNKILGQRASKCPTLQVNGKLLLKILRLLDENKSLNEEGMIHFLKHWLLSLFSLIYTDIYGASQVALVVKNLPANVNAGDRRDLGSIPGSGRSPGGGHGHPLQYSCLENPMDEGAWQATIHRVAKSQTQMKRLSKHAHTHTYIYSHLLKSENKSCHVLLGFFIKSQLEYLWTIRKIFSLIFPENWKLLSLASFNKLYFLLVNWFILFLAVLGLHCHTWAFSSCGERGLLFIALHWLLTALISCCGKQALGTQASVVVRHGLLLPWACGIFPDQESNPCPLPWQVDSYALYHQGSSNKF